MAYAQFTVYMVAVFPEGTDRDIEIFCYFIGGTVMNQLPQDLGFFFAETIISDTLAKSEPSALAVYVILFQPVGQMILYHIQNKYMLLGKILLQLLSVPVPCRF